MRYCVLNISGQNNVIEEFENSCKKHERKFYLVMGEINNKFGFRVVKITPEEILEDYLQDEQYYRIYEIDNDERIIIQGSV